MMFRLAAGCCVVATLAFLSPVRREPLVPPLPAAVPGGALAEAVGRTLAPAAGLHLPVDKTAEAALTDLIVKEAVAQGTARARDKLASVLGPAPERTWSRDTLKPADRLPAWRGNPSKS
jgi:hypothetical protein